MHSSNHMHRASAPGSGRLDLSLAGRRASRRTRSQRVAVVVAQVAPALLRSSSMEVLERPSAQDPAESGHECHNRGTATMSRSSAHTHTRRWHALRACGGDNQSNQGTSPPPVLADLSCPLSLGPRIPWAHALLMAVHEVVGTQHAPARARLRLAAVLVARTTSCWSVRAMGRSGRATVRPPCSS